MTETGRAGRRNRASLGRIKVLAVILSIVAFIGTLAGVAITNPATAQRSQQVVQTASLSQNPDIQAQSSGEGRFVPSRAQLPRLRPMTRTRGS
jgi:hypothetical protein